MSEAHIIRPGLLTTIQDLGRWGFQSRGVSVAGPMDACSHRVANGLVGNLPEAATLEVTLLGPALEFDDERVVAVTGAEFELMMDGRSVPMNRRLRAGGGSCLAFGRRLKGARAYVAIEGGLDLPPIFGSRATHAATSTGGIDGRSLRAGDRLPLGPKGSRIDFAHDRWAARTDLPDGRARVRVLPGPQLDYFREDALGVLQAAPYMITQRSDRMGFRLEGEPLAHARGADIISDATPMGALQVPASGLPILLMADRLTTGGYPKIATVITADLGLAGQLGPGDTISFVVCSLSEAMTALMAQERALMAVERREST